MPVRRAVRTLTARAVAGAAGLAISGGEGQDADVGAASEGVRHEQSADVGPPGLAGYIDDQGPNGWDTPDPVLDLGTGRFEVRGVEITDLDGVLLGYAIAGVGLVDRATARDTAVVDRLMAEAAAQQAAEPQMSEEDVAEMFGIDADGG